MLETADCKLIDLGRDVPPAEFIRQAESVGAKIIAIGTLMTTTMPGMEEVSRLLTANGNRDDFHLLIGGGPFHKPLPTRSALTYMPSMRRRRAQGTRLARSDRRLRLTQPG